MSLVYYKRYILPMEIPIYNIVGSIVRREKKDWNDLNNTGNSNVMVNVYWCSLELLLLNFPCTE